MDRAIELTVIAVYLGFLLLVGTAFRKLNLTVSDYFRNGCRGTWWLVGGSIFMSGISAVSFTGNAGVVFEAGWSILVVYITNVVAGVIAAVWLGPWFRQLRAITAPEVIRLRFGPITQQVYAYVGLIMSIPGAGITLWALAIFTSTIFGIDINLVIVTLGVVVIVYSMTGGSWAVMATDFIQGLLMVAMTILVTVLCLREIGGIAGLTDLISARHLAEDFRVIKPSGAFPEERYTWSWAIGISAIQLMHFIGLTSAPRFFSVKDGREARRAAIFATLLMALGTTFWFIPPIVARLLYETQTLAVDLAKPADAAYAVASMHVLPRGLGGMMAAAMFAATMSSMDTALNRTAAVLVNDIAPPLARVCRRPLPSDKGLVQLSRAFTLILGLAVIGAALYFAGVGGKGMFELMFTISGLVGLPLVIPMVYGVFFRRVPGWAALCSLAFSLVPALVSLVGPRLGVMAPWTVQQNALWILPVGTVGFFLPALFWGRTAADERTRIAGFFVRMRTPVDFAKEVGESNDAKQLQLVGGFSLVLGIFVSALVLVPNPVGGRLCIAAVAGVMLAVGATLLWAARRQQARVRQAT